MGIVNASTKELEKMVNQAGALPLIEKLAEDLAKYGFEGKISVDLKVEVYEKDNTITTTTRTFSSNYRR